MRTRAVWLACAVLSVNMLIIASFIFLRLAMMAGWWDRARGLSVSVRDLAQWAFALELGLAGLLSLCCLGLWRSLPAGLIALSMSALAVIELSGLHYAVEAALNVHLMHVGLTGDLVHRLGKLGVYVMIGLLAAAPAMLAMQFSGERSELVLVKRFLLILLALAVGSGLTDTLGGFVKPLISGGRGSLVLLEMTGELLSAAFAVWLLADQLDSGRHASGLLPASGLVNPSKWFQTLAAAHVPAIGKSRWKFASGCHDRHRNTP
ncbi:MAG: hypothetical protein H6851_08445 [Geminicoccaceae bacterium]|nr:hypothetical protein [Geminicoccaceae bacterium]